MHRHRAIRNGFTLVELLVVIGIIALLISILLPALGRARQIAQRTACAAKLHSIILAAQLHRQDHQDFYPLAGALPGSQPGQLDDAYAQRYDYLPASTDASGSWPDRTLAPITNALEAQLAGKQAYSAGGSMGAPGNDARVAAMLDPNGYTKFFLCPSQGTTALDTIANGSAKTCLYYYSGSTVLEAPQSYIFNEYVLGWDDTYGHLRGKASMIHQPALTMFAADGAGGSTSASHGSYGALAVPMFTVYNNTIAQPVTLADAFNNTPTIAGDKSCFDLIRHKNKINIAFFDGHVESRDIGGSTVGGVRMAATGAGGLDSVYIRAQ